MFNRLVRAWQYTITILMALLTAPRRNLLWQMVAFSQNLPDYFNYSLPEMMARLTPAPNPRLIFSPDDIRRLADAVAAWHVHSPLGICLRRSLLRYHFLQQAGVPVKIMFGARIKGQKEGGGLGGHAWLTLNGNPYYENPKDYEGFVVLYGYPE